MCHCATCDPGARKTPKIGPKGVDLIFKKMNANVNKLARLAIEAGASKAEVNRTRLACGAAVGFARMVIEEHK